MGKLDRVIVERELKIYSNLPLCKIQKAAKPFNGLFVEHIKTECSYHYLHVRFEEMEYYEAFLIFLGMEIQAMICEK